MALQEFYACVGGDYEGVKGRLATDERIEKFVKIFFDDPTYENLLSFYADGDMKESFRMAHTLKGVSRDLGFMPLFEVADKLADAFRPDDEGNPRDLAAVPELLEKVKVQYQDILNARDLL